MDFRDKVVGGRVRSTPSKEVCGRRPPPSTPDYTPAPFPDHYPGADVHTLAMYSLNFPNLCDNFLRKLVSEIEKTCNVQKSDLRTLSKVVTFQKYKDL